MPDLHLPGAADPWTAHRLPAPDYVECEWFAACHEPSTATVDHPTLGPVECCAAHVAWLSEDFSPTKMVPPIAARALAHTR